MVTMIQPSLLTVVGHLAVALGLASLIGLEREYRQKSVGLRTNALVGLGAALFMVISKYGFFDVLEQGIRFDPSRIAAQVVTGIGFIGGGIIFVRRSDVRGLTTAAGVWLTAAVGMAARGGPARGGGHRDRCLLSGGLQLSSSDRCRPPVTAGTLVAPSRVLRRARGLACRPRRSHPKGLRDRGAARCSRRAGLRPGTRERVGRAAIARHRPAASRFHVELELVGRSSPLELADALGGIDGMRAVRTEDPREEPR